MSLALVRVGDHGKVTGVNADPVRLIGARWRKRSTQE
jgi:hypothetical protein